jgi:hypothetical protein
LTAATRQLGQIAVDHTPEREQPAVLGDEPNETLRQFGDARLLEEGAHRPALIAARQHGAAHQAVQIGTLDEHLLDGGQVLSDLVQRLVFVRKLKQGSRVSPCQPGYSCTFGCHAVPRFGL